ncbi:MAG: hypothetical protein AB7E47_04225 [Desulfovibrionaceae bacterium]
MEDNHRSTATEDSQGGGLRERLPGVARVMDQYGRLTLAEYCRTFSVNHATPPQSAADFVAVCSDYARRLLGDTIADRLARRLERHPVVLTANHHCVDYHSLFVQGNILFGLALAFDDAFAPCPDEVVPILAFGTVSMGNQVNPRGIVLSRDCTSLPERYSQVRKQVRVNIFPASMRRTMVTLAPAFTRSMVGLGVKGARQLRRDKIIGDVECATVESLLHKEYLDPRVLAMPSYSDQAVLLNSKVWRRLFAADMGRDLPELAALEIEEVVARLMEHDLANPDSLLYRVLFDTGLRSHVLRNLDGAYGCWEIESLVQCLDPGMSIRVREDVAGKSGTFFFWGRGPKDRHIRYAMGLHEGDLHLMAIDGDGVVNVVPFTPEALAQGVRERTLFPSLFTSFLTVALARGIKCYGGFWQSDYLPIMQKGVCDALAACGQTTLAAQVGSVPTANYVTGMTMAVAEYPDGLVRPAGTVEIAIKGGLDRSDLARLATITVEEANLFGLMEICKNFSLEDEIRVDPLLNVDEANKRRIAEKMVGIKL